MHHLRRSRGLTRFFTSFHLSQGILEVLGHLLPFLLNILTACCVQCSGTMHNKTKHCSNQNGNQRLT